MASTSEPERLWETAFGMPQIDSHILKPLLDARLKACDQLLDLIDYLASKGRAQRIAVLMYRGQASLDLGLVEETMVGQQGIFAWERENFGLQLEHLRQRLSRTDEVDEAWDKEHEDLSQQAPGEEWTPPDVSPFNRRPM